MVYVKPCVKMFYDLHLANSTLNVDKILDLRNWRSVEHRLKIQPHTIGIYLIQKKDTGEIYYIGQSDNIRTRLGQQHPHYQDYDPNTDILFLDDADLKCSEIRDAIEKLLIEVLFPTANIKLKRFSPEKPEIKMQPLSDARIKIYQSWTDERRFRSVAA